MSETETPREPSDDFLYSVMHHEGGGVTLVFYGHLNGSAAGVDAEMVMSVELPGGMAERLAEELRSRSR